jgi:predicted lactoylglutathione lyase
MQAGWTRQHLEPGGEVCLDCGREGLTALLYNRAFADPDGHVFEALWTDMNAAPVGGADEQIESHTG